MSKDATSTQKLMWNMGVVMAQSYTDQLSDNVRRSMKHKVSNGEWCGLAPIGYLNTIDKRTGKAFVVPNNQNAQIIKRLFEEYSSGNYSVAELSRRANAWGLKSNKGNRVYAQQLHTIIENPFYYGVMKVKGELHPHNYDPIISKELFDKCQQVREGRSQVQPRRDYKHDFLFSGLLTCAVSNRLVTCDLKKGKYVYLICRNPDAPDKKLWVSESHVLDQIEDALRSLIISDEDIDGVIAYIKKTSASEQTNQRELKHRYRRELADIEVKIDRLTDLLVNNHITEDAHQRKISQLQSQYDTITAHANTQQVTVKDTETALITLVRLMNSIGVVIKSSKGSKMKKIKNGWWHHSNSM